MLIGVVVVACVFAFNAWANPGVALGVSWTKLAIGFAIAPVVVLLQPMLLSVIPNQVKVSGRGLHVTHGNSGHFIKSKQVVRAGILFDELGRPLLEIVMKDRKGVERSKRYGISEKVDLEELAVALGRIAPVGDEDMRNGPGH